MTAFLSATYKELLNLIRDIHGLLLLFVMPAVFILIMSLALKGEFDNRTSVTLHGHYATADTGIYATKALDFLNTGAIALLPAEQTESLRQLNQDKLQFAVFFPANFSQNLIDNKSQQAVEITLAPSVTAPVRLLITAAVKEALARCRLEINLEELGAPEDIGSQLIDENLIHVQQLGSSGTQAPSSVQQSVPAWLVFAMFFVVVPLAATFISEREQGTLMRLRTMPVRQSTFLLAKIIPFSSINFIQMLLMMAIGAWLVPLLGGDALALDVSIGGLLLMTFAVSFAAIGFALAIATLARTTDQATTLGGVGNLLFGAIGGIMVPQFIMPVAMQKLAVISPMYWGLQGYLDILLRGGNVHSVLFESAILVLWGAAMLAFATFRFNRMSAHGR